MHLILTKAVRQILFHTRRGVGLLIRVCQFLHRHRAKYLNLRFVASSGVVVLARVGRQSFDKRLVTQWVRV